jgi:hypothetical protein
MSAVDCSRCGTPTEAGDLRCSICAEPTELRLDPGQAVPTSLLRCTGCSAALAHEAGSTEFACCFCGEPLSLVQSLDPLEEVEASLPFQVSAKEARASLKKWLGGQGFFSPSDLKSKARLDSLRPLWWVGWCFDAEALLSWTADSEVGSRAADWAPHSGQVEMRFDDVFVSASRGLSLSETLTLESSYDLETAVKEPESIEGALKEEFDVQRSAARALILNSLKRDAAWRIERDEVPGSSCRNLHFVPLLRSLVTRRLAFPAWVLAYRYRDELYRVVISGQDAHCLHGASPTSWVKVLLAIACGLSLLVLLSAALALLG